MSRTLIRAPEGADTSEWDHLPDEDGVSVFKIQAQASELVNLNRNQTVLQIGRHMFFIKKAQRLPGPPTQPPAQPYKVWCTRT